MAYRTNRKHFVHFRVVGAGGALVTGLTLSSFTTIFLVDDVASTDSLALVEIATGLYSCSYTPSKAGFYFLELYNAANTFRYSDSIEVDTVDTFFGIDNSIVLTQDYGSVGRFKVTVPNPQTYTLYIYKSSDWVAGNKGISYVVNSTTLDVNGNWVTSSLSVAHDTYHIVISDTVNTTVLTSFLVV